MLNFIFGAVAGGFVALLCMALVTVSKKSECAECEYYKNRFFGMLDYIKSVIQKFRNKEVTAENAIIQIENELRL